MSAPVHNGAVTCIVLPRRPARPLWQAARRAKAAQPIVSLPPATAIAPPVVSLPPATAIAPMPVVRALEPLDRPPDLCTEANGRDTAHEHTSASTAPKNNAPIPYAPVENASETEGGTLGQRHLPRSGAQLLGNRDAIAALRAWIAQRKAHDPSARRAAYLHGECGAGKSMAARVLLHEAGYEVHEINANTLLASAHGGTLAARIRAVVTRQPLFGPRAVLIDEYEALVQVRRACRQQDTPGTSSGDLHAMLRALGAACPPIVFTCSDQSETECRELAAQCVELRFYRPYEQVLVALLARVAAAERLVLPPATARLLAQQARGNVRAALNALEWHVRRGAPSVVALTADNGTDLFAHPFDVTRTLLRSNAGLRAEHALHLYQSDASLLSAMVHENYVDSFGGEGPMLARQLHRMAHAADCLSAAQHTQTWPDANPAATLLDAWSVDVCARAAPQRPRADCDYARLRFAQSLRDSARVRRERGARIDMLRKLSFAPALSLCGAPLCDHDALCASYRRALLGCPEADALAVLVRMQVGDAQLAQLLGDDSTKKPTRVPHALLLRLQALRYEGARRDAPAAKRTRRAKAQV